MLPRPWSRRLWIRQSIPGGRAHTNGVEIRMSEGFDVLTGRSWLELCQLNPSLDRALKLCKGWWHELLAQ